MNYQQSTNLFILAVSLKIRYGGVLTFMSLDFGEGVDKVRVRVLTENTTDITLLTDPKFRERVHQPGASTLMCWAEHGLAMLFEVTMGNSGMM